MKCQNCGSIIPDDLTICSVCKKPVKGVRLNTNSPDTTMCPCCGESNFRGINICAKCGSPLAPQRGQATQNGQRTQTKSAPGKAPTKKKTRLNPKFFIAVAAIFLVIVAAIVAVIFAVRNSKDDVPSSVIQSFYSKSDGSTVFACDGKELISINGHTKSVASNKDGSVLAVLESSGILSCVRNTGAVTIAENVLECKISDDGGVVAYILNEEIPESVTEAETVTADTESEANDSEELDDTTESETQTSALLGGTMQSLSVKSDTSLFSYDCESSSSSLVSNNVSAASVTLSPDGKTIAYTLGAADGSGFECYICSGGIYTSLGKNISVVAVSDDAAYCYYLKHESYNDSYAVKLFAKSASADIKLGEFADITELRCFLNKSYSQIVFSLNGSDGNFFISSECSEKKKLSTGFACCSVADEPERVIGYTTVCPVDSFDGAVFTDLERTAFYLDASLSPTVIAEDTALIGRTEETVYYIDLNDYLYSCPISSMTDKAKLASHVNTFSLSADGKKLWYTNSDNELHCIISGSDNTVSSKMYTPSTGLTLTRDGCVYFLEDYSFSSGSLYYCENGKDKKAVEGADNVYDVIADSSGCVYYRSDYSGVSGSFDLFYGEKNSFEKILDGDKSSAEVSTNA